MTSTSPDAERQRLPLFVLVGVCFLTLKSCWSLDGRFWSLGPSLTLLMQNKQERSDAFQNKSRSSLESEP